MFSREKAYRTRSGEKIAAIIPGLTTAKPIVVLSNGRQYCVNQQGHALGPLAGNDPDDLVEIQGNLAETPDKPPIDPLKKYRTRAGVPVSALIPLPNSGGGFVAVLENGRFYSVEPNGETHLSPLISANLAFALALVEVPSYEDFKIDDLVLVRDSPDHPWTPGHFAGVSSSGEALTFAEGTTSWSGRHRKQIPWSFCRKLDPKDVSAT